MATAFELSRRRFLFGALSLLITGGAAAIFGYQHAGEILSKAGLTETGKDLLLDYQWRTMWEIASDQWWQAYGFKLSNNPQYTPLLTLLKTGVEQYTRNTGKQVYAEPFKQRLSFSELSDGILASSAIKEIQAMNLKELSDFSHNSSELLRIGKLGEKAVSEGLRNDQRMAVDAAGNNASGWGYGAIYPGSGIRKRTFELRKRNPSVSFEEAAIFEGKKTHDELLAFAVGQQSRTGKLVHPSDLLEKSLVLNFGNLRNAWEDLAVFYKHEARSIKDGAHNEFYKGPDKSAQLDRISKDFVERYEDPLAVWGAGLKYVYKTKPNKSFPVTSSLSAIGNLYHILDLLRNWEFEPPAIQLGGLLRGLSTVSNDGPIRFASEIAAMREMFSIDRWIKTFQKPVPALS